MFATAQTAKAYSCRTNVRNFFNSINRLGDSIEYTPDRRDTAMVENQITAGSRPVSINMRADPKRRDLIDAAAEILSVDRTSFILDAACRRAEEVIVDRKLFLLSDEAFDRFEQALNANPIRSNECVKELLARPKPWS